MLSRAVTVVHRRMSLPDRLYMSTEGFQLSDFSSSSLVRAMLRDHTYPATLMHLQLGAIGLRASTDKAYAETPAKMVLT